MEFTDKYDLTEGTKLTWPLKLLFYIGGQITMLTLAPLVLSVDSTGAALVLGLCLIIGSIIMTRKVDNEKLILSVALPLFFSGEGEIVERAIERTTKAAKSDKSLLTKLSVLERVRDALADGKSARAVGLDAEEEALIEESRLLTLKPIIYVANIAEDEVSGEYENNEGYKKLKAHAESEGSEIIAVSAQIEAELAELEGEEKLSFLSDLGIEESGLDKLIKSGYSLLGLISFLTAGPKEVRAWTIKKGTKAPGAAGKIHTDFERGFIRAEVVSFDDLVREGDRNKVKEKGLLRSEGKEYVVKDGDIIEFLFNV